MVELRPSTGTCVFTGKTVEHTYDEIMLDGLVIGISFRYANTVHWRYKKKELPPSIRKKAIRMLMDRNAKAGGLNERQRREKLFVG